ncbi:G1 family glutamic endopeptidase [Reyranella sp.]|uniref:G1 family glutamic endopeptidase n=1 Tax=Reyranella sp. TaxID=1929291 RepID=UPI003BADB151
MAQEKDPKGSVSGDKPTHNALFDSLRIELDARIVRQAPLPLPADLDLLDPSLTVGDFVRLGLPPRPTDPQALRLWQEMLPPRLKIVPPFDDSNVGTYAFRADMAFGLSALPADQGDDDVTQARVAKIPRGRLASSRNWSGAAIFANRGDRFNQVIASWTVPAVSAGSGDGPWVCSTWIGIDGLRRWMRSMPQMGTTQVAGDTGERDSDGNPMEYFAWWQWWLRGRTLQVPVVLGPTLKPDDKVYCCMTLLPPGQPDPGDRNHVQFFLRVNDSGHSLRLGPPPSNDPSDDDTPRPVPATGASAEWILERPTALRDSPNGNVKEGDLYPLPRFDTAGADDFQASLATDPDPLVVATIAAAPITPAVNFRTPLKLRMMEHRWDPSRMAVIARPVEARDGRVRIVYRE